jgi:hypothetical protein
MAVQAVLRSGDAAKLNPFTICIVANRYLEAPLNSGAFIPDPIIGNKPSFDRCAKYIVDCLIGALPNQHDGILDDPAILPHVKICTIFDPAPATATDPNQQDSESLIGQDGASYLLIARRTQIKDYLQAQYGKIVDVAYAITSSNTHQRASAWFATDDPANTGVPFNLDGLKLVHCYESFIPGTVALHCTAASLTATHEFGHALSSYQNGMVVDLYIDGNAAVNNKRRRPIPPNFTTYSAAPIVSDMTRGHLGYPVTWQSYHGERNGVAPAGLDLPAIMDNYYMVPGGCHAEQCEHDVVTRKFLKDRLVAKINRP